MKTILINFAVILALTGMGCNRSPEGAEIVNRADPGAQIVELMMATDVDVTNAPKAVAESFGPSQNTIYAVATAKRIEPGTRMFARFEYEGKMLQDTPEIVASKPSADTFVEFHLPRAGDAWPLGKYSAEIFVNGKPAVKKNFVVLQ